MADLRQWCGGTNLTAPTLQSDAPACKSRACAYLGSCKFQIHDLATARVGIPRPLGFDSRSAEEAQPSSAEWIFANSLGRSFERCGGPVSQPARGAFGLPTANRPRSMRSIGWCPCAMAPVARNNSAGGCKTSVSENRHVAGETTPSARSVERSPFRDENNVPPGRLASRAGLGDAFGARRRGRWSRRTRSQGSRPRETPSLRTASLERCRKDSSGAIRLFSNQFRRVTKPR